MKKEIGYIGLGRMGKNMVSRLLDAGWSIVAYDKSVESVQEVVSMGGVGAGSLAEVVSKLPIPRTIWIMVPHQVVEEVINELVPLLTKGDLIIDGGNSPYRESIRRSKELETKGINFLDIGVSGAGHFVKMVHNGIEYGMMQSIAEGFDLMRHSKEFDLDLEKITEVYSHGSVVTSSLVSWMHDGYKKYGKDLNQISGRASASGEGKWTVEAGKRENISMPAIQTAVDVREKSQKKPSYQGKVISTMRGEFGQHSVKKGDDEPEIL